MKILIVNPPHPSIGSRIPREQLPPLGLLCVGGSLLDAGHNVTLLDAEIGPLSHDEIVEKVIIHQPQVLIIGHSGSTSAHPNGGTFGLAIAESKMALHSSNSGVNHRNIKKFPCK